MREAYLRPMCRPGDLHTLHEMVGKSRKTRPLLAVCGIALALWLLPAAAQAQTNHYIRDGASGSSPCTGDWNSACDTLPATLTRGDTYYIADGTYGAYDFNDAVSGTQVITIKKATEADHGSNTGWSSAFGDGQALFIASDQPWVVSTSYYTFNGQVGSGKDANSYGFRAETTEAFGFDSVVMWIVGARTNINISYVHFFTPGQTGASTCDVSCDNNDKQNPNCPFNNHIYGPDGLTNSTIANSYFKSSSWSATLLTRSWSNVTIERNYFRCTYRKELLSDDNSTDIVFRYNTVENSAGTGIIVFRNGADSWDIYGNVFFNNLSAYDYTDCIICHLGGFGFTGTNIRIYNNSFANQQEVADITIAGGSTNEVRNNLFYGPNGITFGSGMTRNHDWCDDTSGVDDCTAVANETNGQIGTSDPFVNLAGENFHLAAATNAGFTLGSPYNVDMDGVTRGADGTWDRGAFDYVTGGGPPPCSGQEDCDDMVGPKGCEVCGFIHPGLAATVALLLGIALLAFRRLFKHGN